MRFTVLDEEAVRGTVQYGEQDDPDYQHASIDISLDPTVHGHGVGRDAVATRPRRWLATSCSTGAITGW